MLTLALQALERGELEAALAALLDAWRLARDDETFELAEVLARQIVSPPLEPSGPSAAQRQHAWMRRARQQQTVDLPSLLQSFTSGDPSDMVERMVALGEWRADLRIGRAVVELGESGRLVEGWESQYWARVQATLEHADLAIVDRLEALLARSMLTPRPRAQRVTELAARRAQLVALPPPGDAAFALVSRVRQRLVELFPHLEPATAASIDGFLAAIRAAPDEDELRMVFADWLIERGDERGELINLQFQRRDRPLTREQARRERKLLAGVTADWLGPLDAIADGITFERGFPAHYHLLPRHQQDARALLGCPAWATVREVDFDYYGTPDWAVALLADPALHGLRAAGNVPDEVAIALAAIGRPLPLEEIGLVGPTVERRREVAEALASASVLPRLRRLHLGLTLTGGVDSPSALRWIWSTSLAPRLERLSLGCDLRKLGDWLAEAPRLPPSLAALRIRPVGDGAIRGGWWHLTLGRDEQGALTRLVAELVPVKEPWDSWGELASALERLDDSALTSIEVRVADRGTAPAAEVAAVAAAARRQRRLATLTLPLVK